MIDLRKPGCEKGRWMILAQERVEWQVLVLVVLNLRFLLPLHIQLRTSNLRDHDRKFGWPRKEPAFIAINVAPTWQIIHIWYQVLDNNCWGKGGLQEER